MTQDTTTYIIDFDSTFIQVESLEVLAQIALANHPEKETRLAQIHQTTVQAMEGLLSFAESLQQRVSLLSLQASFLSQAVAILKNKITPSFARNRHFFKQNAANIYIISGAFIELLWPIVQPFGILREHVFANHLLYDFEGNIVGYDTQNPLAQDAGKIKVAHQLKLTGNVVVVGDGFTDYEIKAAGLAQAFFAFTENVQREKVMKVADGIIAELEGVFISCNVPFTAPGEPKKILLLENIHATVAQQFRNLGFAVEALNGALSENELTEKLKDVHVLGIRSKTEISAHIIEKCPTLEAIGAFCIGTNQIDLVQSSHQGIAVFNAPYSNTRSVVELTIAEIILLVRRAASMNNKLMRGIWHKSSENAHEVRGKILGIVGYGNIGSQLSIIAESIGMRVIFYDLADKLPLGNARACDSLTELLSHADVVSIHVDGRKENKNLIGAKEIALMKDGVILLNLSRGFVIDYEALLAALTTHKIGGIGIDVYPQEPHDSKSTFQTPLQQFDNVILTPHIGGSTEEAQQNIGEYVGKNLISYITEGASVGSVNFPQLTLPTIHHPQRIIHIHKNVPGVLAHINQVFAEFDSNIEGQFLKTNDDIGYVITDINRSIDENMLKALNNIAQTIKVRVINKSL